MSDVLKEVYSDSFKCDVTGVFYKLAGGSFGGLIWPYNCKLINLESYFLFRIAFSFGVTSSFV